MKRVKFDQDLVAELNLLRKEQAGRLLRLLGPYISSEDSELNDERFVQIVIDRFNEELEFRRQQNELE